MKSQHSHKSNNTHQLLIKRDQCINNKKFSNKKALQSHQSRIRDNKNSITTGDEMNRY